MWIMTYFKDGCSEYINIPMVTWISVPVAIVFYFLGSFTNPYDKSCENLHAEKDEFLIWGAAGSLALVLIKERNCLIDSKSWISIIVLSFYLLLLIGIHYRRLSTEIYRREEAKKMAMQKMILRKLSRICKENNVIRNLQEADAKTVITHTPIETKGGKRYTLSVEDLLPK